MKVEVSEYSEKVIYHSPETPGYTSWCTLWPTKEGRLRLAFQQVTGPTERPLDRVNNTIILESPPDAADWRLARQVPPRAGARPRSSGIYTGPGDSAFCGLTMVSLPDGTLVTSLWGGLDMDRDGFIQRSTDEGETWSAPIYLMDKRYRNKPTVIRQLRDGRLLLLSGVWDREGGEPEPPPEGDPRILVKMFFLSDDLGKTWGPPRVLLPPEEGLCEESDFCELPNGDLLWVHRTEHYPSGPVEIPPTADPMADVPYAYSDRRQSTMRRQGDDWIMEPSVSTPFPHSGFPKVLLTNEGLVLHIASQAIWWTADEGASWHALDIPGSSYYPCAMQLEDGRILVIGHDGSDDPYGTVDQHIRQQTFRLNVGN